MPGHNLFVSYDLHAPVKDYPRIEAAIKQLGTVLRVHYSLWYVKTTYNAEQARELLGDAHDSNDKILVIEALAAHWTQLDASIASSVQNLWRS